MIEEFHEVHECRACGSPLLEKYFDLGKIPLVNSLLSTAHESLNIKRFPLAVNFCHNCHLSQLTGMVDPNVLFRNYVYRSSVSEFFGKHCDELAEELNQSILKKNDLVVDIASNDGYLLRFFKKRGNKVLGVDPAVNLAKIANEEGIETIPEFWNEDLAKTLVGKYGPAKAITAFNVFAHVPEIKSFTKGVKILLEEGGYFIIESPYAKNLLEEGAFDTIYHEHVSYLSANTINRFMNSYKLRVAKLKKTDIHGGSLRFYIEHEEDVDTSDGSADKILKEEESEGLHQVDRYKELDFKARKVQRELVSLLRELKNSSKKVCAFGASAKGNILLNYCGITQDLIPCIFDDTPEKQGKFAPGTGIPIMSRDNFNLIKPDYLLLLAWNFKKEMMEKTKNFSSSGGKYITPIPEVEII